MALFVQVAQIEKLFVSEHGVVVEIQFRVERDQPIVLRQ
jgi:hypothetical protein